MAVTFLPKPVRAAYQWGVTLAPDPRRARRIYRCNRFAVESCIAFLMCAGFLPLLRLGRFGAFSLAIACAFAAIPFFNRLGHTRISRLLLLCLANAGIVGFALAFGRASGSQLFLLPVAWLVLILFDWEEPGSTAWGVGLNSIAVLMLEAFGPEKGRFHSLTDGNARILHFASVAMAQTLQVLAVLYFFLANRRTETALAEAGDAARAADKAKSQFLANMSHEIRTPLNGILGMSSLLLKSDLQEAQKDQVQAIQSSGLDLMVIIGEILDLSKIEAGKMKLESAPFALEPLLESIIRPFEHEARRKRLDLRLDLGAGIPGLLLGDPVRLKQVLNNLVGNALKFTPKGGVTLRIRAGETRQAAAGPAVIILACEVEDTGIGIPAEAQGRIFDSFSQADQTSARRYGGTGLGLFISRQIVDMMGGCIGCRSRPGAGSVFHFEIPFSVATGEDGQLVEALTPGADSLAAGQGRESRLLIVEDHPLNQKVLSGFLTQAGFRADLASGGQEALKVFSIAPYDLVFMDCHMPGMDGFECTRTLRGLRFPGKRPIIIGVTADAMRGTREKCMQAGMDDVITKPILTEELHGALSRWLGKSGPSRTPVTSLLHRSDWLDLSHLREMDEWIRTYDPRFWERAQDQFRGSAHRLLASIRESCATGRSSEAGESVHSLKGLCMMLGLSRMAQSCKSLENLCAGGDPGWEPLVSELESSLEPSLAEMRKQVGRA
ncbi:MAG: signal transduction histidine kinase [Fibrobacteres bacterium]|nr:signal transduction histidine kinase [Fibrobacterota bacterium]